MISCRALVTKLVGRTNGSHCQELCRKWASIIPKLSVMSTGHEKARSVFGLLLQGMTTMRAFIGSMHEGNLEELDQT